MQSAEQGFVAAPHLQIGEGKDPATDLLFIVQATHNLCADLNKKKKTTCQKIK